MRTDGGVTLKQADLFHVGLNAADEERVGYTQSGHESMEGVLKRQRKKIEIAVLSCHIAVNTITIVTPSMIITGKKAKH